MRGLSAPHRVSIVCRWAKTKLKSTKIIALQEMITEGPRLVKALNKLVEDQNRARKAVSYFKLNARCLKNDAARREMQEQWERHPEWARDPWKIWSLALGRLRQVGRRHKLQFDKEVPDVLLLQAKLSQARFTVQDDPTEENAHAFEEAQNQMRNREKADAYISRIRCRIKWLREGDVPTHFFFARYKAKLAQERLTALKLESGFVVTDEVIVFSQIQETFSSLYLAEREDDHIAELREGVLQLIDKRLSVTQNNILKEFPSPELIEETARALPSEKAPGIDGNTGCKVAVPGQQFKYLGILAGCPIDEKAIAKAIIEKIEKRLAHWSNRLLSWPARTLLLKHVLAATPLYQLISVGLATEGIDALEKLCRQFLWGWSDQGSPKTALISWDRISQPKQNGGLGWVPIRDRAKAFHIKILAQLLLGSEAEWAVLAKNLVLRTLRSGQYQQERRQWSLAEGLIFLPGTKINGSPTLSRMMQSWKTIRSKMIGTSTKEKYR
ncbi:hypothetical protein R1sor_013045 [Riccia sorocarpa]|uniref:Reverse transcriptase n=1 Tax=Riccia sorocarpa TaxID=122646 RepID=A0ABD3H796_9MARC